MSVVFYAGMTDPFPETPDGAADQSIADQGILDRSEQAARFLDLARQHALLPDEPSDLNPLIAARLHDGIEDSARAFDAEVFGASDVSDAGDDEDFGDGNGFGAGAPFGVDETPLNPFD